LKFRFKAIADEWGMIFNKDGIYNYNLEAALCRASQGKVIFMGNFQTS
jgi:hypothetical protein